MAIINCFFTAGLRKSSRIFCSVFFTKLLLKHATNLIHQRSIINEESRKNHINISYFIYSS